MKRILPLFGGCVLFSISILCVFSCSRKTDTDGGTVFKAALLDDPFSLDPAVANDVPSFSVISNVYEPLYHYDSFASEFRAVPLLATGFPELMEGGKKARVHLRPRVRFQDSPCFPNGLGREVEARDFIYAWKRLLDPRIESQGGWIFDSRIMGVKDFQKRLTDSKTKEERDLAFQSELKGVRAVDSKTIEFTLVAPDPRLALILTMAQTAPLPEEAVKKCGNEKGVLVTEMIGTGPFVLKEWRRGSVLRLEKNPHYREEKMKDGSPIPALAGIRYDVIKEQSPAWLQFLKGDLDLLPVPKDQFKHVIESGTELTNEMKEKGIRLHVEGGVRNFFLEIHMRDPLLGKNKKLRQAISSAIPRQEFIDLFAAGKGTPMTSLLPPGIPDRVTSPKIRYDFSLETGKKLLAEAGFPEGKGLPVFKLDLRGADSSNRQIGEWLERKLEAVGIKVTVIANTFPAYLDKLKTGNYQIAYSGWAMDYPDPEDNYQLLYGPNKSPGPNDAFFENPKYDSVFKEMAALPPGEKRAGLIRELEGIVQEEVPWVYLYDHKDFRLAQPWVKNFRGGGEMILDGLRYVSLDAKNRK